MHFPKQAYKYPQLPSRAVAVYSCLCQHEDKEGKAWPSINTIAFELSLSRSTVKRALSDLEKVGLIRVEKRYRKNGGNSVNNYWLTD